MQDTNILQQPLAFFLNHLIKSSLEYLLYIEEKTTHSGKKLRLTYFFS